MLALSILATVYALFWAWILWEWKHAPTCKGDDCE